MVGMFSETSINVVSWSYMSHPQEARQQCANNNRLNEKCNTIQIVEEQQGSKKLQIALGHSLWWQEDRSACPVDGSRPLWRDDGRALSLNCFHVVGGQHAGLAGALHGAVHPALVDGLHVDDDVAVFERHLVAVCRHVVIHGTHCFLRKAKRRMFEKSLMLEFYIQNWGTLFGWNVFKGQKRNLVYTSKPKVYMLASKA